MTIQQQGGIQWFSKPKPLDLTAIQLRQDKRSKKMKNPGSVRVGWALWLRGDDTMPVRGGPWPRPGRLGMVKIVCDKTEHSK
jgi:hypothetical protein